MTMRPCRSIVSSVTPRCCRSQSWNSTTRRWGVGNAGFGLRWTDSALAEKLDEPAYPPHVLRGHAPLATDAGALTAMPSEPIGDAIIDISDCDLGQRQPLREVTGCSVIAAHRQASYAPTSSGVVRTPSPAGRDRRRQCSAARGSDPLSTWPFLVSLSLPSRQEGRPQIMRS